MATPFVHLTFHWKGLLALAAFIAALSLAGEPQLGVIAVAAWAVIEVLLWSGVAGLGRGGKAKHL